MKPLIERAKQIEAEGVFIGGAMDVFEASGSHTLMTLLSEGLNPASRVLDIGCGCLRNGYWLIHFLDQGCYFGIEPNVVMLDAGRRILLEPELEGLKQPRFDHNAAFDFGVFNERFDFFVARSIWSHASKQQIQAMLDGFVKTADAGGIFITSYIRTSLFRRDYQGSAWVGKSHEADVAGCISHSWRWIRTECSNRGLMAEEIRDRALNFAEQTWIRIQRNR